MEKTWDFNSVDAEPARVTEEIVQLVLEHVPANQVYRDQIQHDLRLVIIEALVNHVKHGNRFQGDKKVHVQVSLTENGEMQKLLVQSEDEGKGFDPDDIPDPTDVENLERPCGRGLLLMRHYPMKYGGSIEFNEQGNRVAMMFLLQKSASANGE